MTNGFCKVFSDMLTSSVWLTTEKETKLLWLTMLLMADQRGIVATGVLGLSRMSMLTIPETEEALAVLLSPDPHSKTPDMEGRRVIPIDGGWQIVNYSKYRDKWVGVKKRSDGVARQQAYRARKKAGLPPAKRGRPRKHPLPETPKPSPPKVSSLTELESAADAEW